MKNNNKSTMTSNDLMEILSRAVTELDVISTGESNKVFSRQIAKAREIGNIAGKMISMTGQQLYAIELGAQVEVPLLGIKESTSIDLVQTTKPRKKLG